MLSGVFMGLVKDNDKKERIHVFHRLTRNKMFSLYLVISFLCTFGAAVINGTEKAAGLERYSSSVI